MKLKSYKFLLPGLVILGMIIESSVACYRKKHVFGQYGPPNKTLILEASDFEQPCRTEVHCRKPDLVCDTRIMKCVCRDPTIRVPGEKSSPLLFQVYNKITKKCESIVGKMCTPHTIQVDDLKFIRCVPYAHCEPSRNAEDLGFCQCMEGYEETDDHLCAPKKITTTTTVVSVVHPQLPPSSSSDKDKLAQASFSKNPLLEGTSGSNSNSNSQPDPSTTAKDLKKEKAELNEGIEISKAGKARMAIVENDSKHKPKHNHHPHSKSGSSQSFRSKKFDWRGIAIMVGIMILMFLIQIVINDVGGGYLYVVRW